jgi:hypothetical protein
MIQYDPFICLGQYSVVMTGIHILMSYSLKDIPLIILDDEFTPNFPIIKCPFLVTTECMRKLEVTQNMVLILQR